MPSAKHGLIGMICGYSGSCPANLASWRHKRCIRLPRKLLHKSHGLKNAYNASHVLNTVQLLYHRIVVEPTYDKEPNSAFSSLVFCLFQPCHRELLSLANVRDDVPARQGILLYKSCLSILHPSSTRRVLLPDRNNKMSNAAQGVPLVLHLSHCRHLYLCSRLLPPVRTGSWPSKDGRKEPKPIFGI
jgi:hypothetical protein